MPLVSRSTEETTDGTRTDSKVATGGKEAQEKKKHLFATLVFFFFFAPETKKDDGAFTTPPFFLISFGTGYQDVPRYCGPKAPRRAPQMFCHSDSAMATAPASRAPFIKRNGISEIDARRTGQGWPSLPKVFFEKRKKERDLEGFLSVSDHRRPR